jgi:hypothetical protein
LKENKVVFSFSNEKNSLAIKIGEKTYGNRVRRIDDKMTQGKSESSAGTLNRDAAWTANITAIT